MKLCYVGIVAIFSMLLMAAYAVGSDKTPEKIVVAADDSAAVGADGFRLPEQKVKSTAAEIPPLASDKSPHDVAMAAEKGTLKNPYNYKPMNQDLVAAGRKNT